MDKVCVFATLWIAPGEVGRVTTELLAHRARCLADEPGTLVFELMLPREAAETVHIYEAYENQAAFERHWNGASMAELRRTTGESMNIVSGIWGTPLEA